MSNYDDVRLKYQYGVIETYYNNMLLNKKGFTKDTILNFLNELSTEDLKNIKHYANEINWDLYYSYLKNINIDYDGIEAKNNLFISIINNILDSRGISRNI